MFAHRPRIRTLAAGTVSAVGVGFSVFAVWHQFATRDGMLSEVFENLLHNAIRHNDAETPEVHVEVTDTPETVVDSRGQRPGHPRRLESGAVRQGEEGHRQSGTGFGLYIVDMLVERYRGTISVADDRPRGTAFTVELAKA